MNKEKKRILLIEDDAELVHAIQLRLEANHYAVLSAADGNEGLQKVHQERPDLIILDIRLPKMDGFKLCRMIKYDEEYKGIPVIILTARVQPADIEMGKEVGADVYMTKPFKNEELLHNIETLLTAAA